MQIGRLFIMKSQGQWLDESLMCIVMLYGQMAIVQHKNLFSDRNIAAQNSPRQLVVTVLLLEVTQKT